MTNNQNILTDQYVLRANVTQDDDGSFLAVCPDWTDCYAQGETVNEALTELNHVAAGLIELYEEESMTIPLEVVSKNSNNGELVDVSMPLIISRD